MHRFRLVLTLAVVAAAAACESSPVEAPDAPGAEMAAAVVGQGIPLHATVQFGRDDVGSPFPPPSGHDQSGHARDKQFPRTVQIRAGGTVTFEMGTFHQVAIYDDGKLPGDVDADDLIDLTAPNGMVIIPQVLIDDADGRLAVGPFSLAPMTWTSPAGTFDTPGRYLVICTFRFHFVDANMYAWVVVR